MTKIDLSSPPRLTIPEGEDVWQFGDPFARHVTVLRYPVGHLLRRDEPWLVTVFVGTALVESRRAASIEEATRLATILFPLPRRDRVAETWARRQSTAFGKGFKRLPKHLKKDAA